MLTGRWVDPSTGGHGVTINSRTSRTVHDFAGEYVASVFDAVHDAGGSTALFASKEKFDLFDRSWSDGAPDTTGGDDGRDKIDQFTVVEDNDELLAEVVDDLSRRRRALTFVHLSAPDEAGHASGFLGRRYLRAVGETDLRLGRLVEELTRLQAERPIVLVVTADHGGDGDAHSTVADPDNYTVPVVVWGTQVPAGRDLYDLNPDRAQPGRGRVPDRAERQPIRNADLANLVTSLLGLDPVPGSQIGVERPFAVR
jgi:predicted AlkP superfamily pyrophosphatase or phosphodiesterase